MTRFKDITGQKFSRLTAMQPVETKSKHKKWLCECECGRQSIVNGRDLRKGTTRSCGCLVLENVSGVTHGMSKTHSAEYRTWTRMKSRCSDQKNPSYGHYGARGIKVCQEWENDFAAFLRDMGTRPKEHSIERIDNDMGYCPSNCKWADILEQNNNRRINKFITVNGITRTKSQWARSMGIKRDTLGWRLKTGKTINNMKEYANGGSNLVLQG